VVTGIGWANSPDNVRQQGVLPEVERTLNWVVLASRFPVRIEINERDPEHPLRMGMTAFVTVLDRPAEIPGRSPVSKKGVSKTRFRDEARRYAAHFSPEQNPKHSLVRNQPGTILRAELKDFPGRRVAATRLFIVAMIIALVSQTLHVPPLGRLRFLSV